MRLLIVLILGLGFSYTLSYDAPVREEYTPKSAYTHYDRVEPEEVSNAAGISAKIAEFDVVTKISPVSTHLHTFSESWWESRFSYLEDK